MIETKWAHLAHSIVAICRHTVHNYHIKYITYELVPAQEETVVFRRYFKPGRISPTRYPGRIPDYSGRSVRRGRRRLFVPDSAGETARYGRTSSYPLCR